MLEKAFVKAGLSHCCPHGLRKAAARRCREAGCTADGDMAITGRKTVEEYRHYAGEAATGVRATRYDGKGYGRPSQKVAKRNAQGLAKQAKSLSRLDAP